VSNNAASESVDYGFSDFLVLRCVLEMFSSAPVVLSRYMYIDRYFYMLVRYNICVLIETRGRFFSLQAATGHRSNVRVLADGARKPREGTTILERANERHARGRAAYNDNTRSRPPKPQAGKKGSVIRSDNLAIDLPPASDRDTAEKVNARAHRGMPMFVVSVVRVVRVRETSWAI
jgi:hypothetical protein